MENFVRTETHLDLDTQREPNPCEMRITTQGKLRNYISYATILLNDKRSGTISLLAMGKAISKAISIAEILKKRITGLVQTTEIGSTSFTETYEPLVLGLEQVRQTRHVSLIKIILTDTRSHVPPTSNNTAGTSTIEGATGEEGEGTSSTGQFTDNKRGYRGARGGRGGRGRGGRGRGRGGPRPYYGGAGNAANGPYTDQHQQPQQHIQQQQPLQQQQPPLTRNVQQQQFAQQSQLPAQQSYPRQQQQHHQQQSHQQHQQQPWGPSPASQSPPVFSETWGEAQGFDMVPPQADYHRPRGRGRGRGNSNRGRGGSSGSSVRGSYNRQ